MSDDSFYWLTPTRAWLVALVARLLGRWGVLVYGDRQACPHPATTPHEESGHLVCVACGMGGIRVKGYRPPKAMDHRPESPGRKP
jgi:hypothetical protein